MRHAALPFIQSLEALAAIDPKKAIESRTIAADVLFKCDGFQFILHILQTEETQALDAIKAGLATERNVGRLQTVERIRNSLRALLPVSGELDVADEVQEDLLPPYESGFAIPIDG